MTKKPRLIIFFVLFLFFFSLVIFSVWKVRYDVSGSSQKEPYIVEKSITHSIGRNQNGGLIGGGAPVSGDTGLSVDTARVTPQKPEVKEKPKPCPT